MTCHTNLNVCVVVGSTDSKTITYEILCDALLREVNKKRFRFYNVTLFDSDELDLHNK